MGTERVDYIILGMKFDYKTFMVIHEGDNFDEWEDNPYREEITTNDRHIVLIDGMNGQYVIAGLIIAKSIDSGFDPISLIATNEQIVSVSNWLTSNLGINQLDIKHWIVSHYH